MKSPIWTSFSVWNSLACVAALARANLAGHRAGLSRAVMLSSAMFLQNFLFFMVWVVFFSSVGQIKGWRLEEVSLLYGLAAAAVGLAMFISNGARTLPFLVRDGGFDAFITRPRHPLPALLLSHSSMASVGDLFSAPVYWFVFGGASLGQLPLLIGLSLLSAIIFMSAVIVLCSVAFWIPKSGRLADQLFEMLIIFVLIPQHVQPLGVKLVTYSLLPAGFISLIPVSLLIEFNGAAFAILLAAAAGYAALAIAVFNAGLRRYVSQPV
jgi:ABC-2 type transport system permease protein